MKDRVPTYPGRVVLSPVVGQENTFDMVRADEPTQEGTKINKNSLLSDYSALLFGLGQEATPNDVFSEIGNYINNKAVKIEIGSYIGNGLYGQSNPNILTFSFVPKIVIISPKDVTKYQIIVSNGVSSYISRRDSSANYGHNNLTWSENSLSWYCSAGDSYSPAGGQLNQSGTEYIYTAIG